MHPTQNAYDVTLKAGNMYLNRFCIDEDAAIESFGLHNFQTLAVNLDMEETGTELIHSSRICRKND